MREFYDEGIRTLKLLRIALFTFIYLAISLIAFPIAIYTMPDIESLVFPPIKAQQIKDLHFDPVDNHYLLWEWSFLKSRKAYPYFVTFMAYREGNTLARYAVDTYVGWDCKNNMRSDRTNLPSTTRQSRKLCVRLPDELAGKPDVRVDGIIDFKVGHDFYTVPVTIPPSDVNVPTGIPFAPSVR